MKQNKKKNKQRNSLIILLGRLYVPLQGHHNWLNMIWLLYCERYEREKDSLRIQEISMLLDVGYIIMSTWF